MSSQRQSKKSTSKKRKESPQQLKSTPEKVATALVASLPKLQKLAHGFEVFKAANLIGQKWDQISSFTSQDKSEEREDIETAARDIRSFGSVNGGLQAENESTKVREVIKRIKKVIESSPRAQEFLNTSPFPLDKNEINQIIRSAGKNPSLGSQPMTQGALQKNLDRWAASFVRNGEKLAEIGNHVERLLDVLSTLNDDSEDREILEKEFIKMAKDVSLKLSRSSQFSKQNTASSFEEMYESVQNWYTDTEKQMKNIITVCYVEHAMINDVYDDEEKRHLWETRNLVIEDMKANFSILSHICNEPYVAIQREKFPVCYSFHPSFAIETTDTGEIFLGDMPCHTFRTYVDDHTLSQYLELYDYRRTSTHFFQPRILGCLPDLAGFTVVFERVPKFVPEHKAVSQAHLKEMLLCINSFVNRATDLLIILDLNHCQKDVHITHDCKAYIVPRGPIPAVTDQMEEIDCHKMQNIYIANQRCIGWFIQQYIFGQTGDGETKDLFQIAKNDEFLKRMAHVHRLLDTMAQGLVYSSREEITEMINRSIPTTHACRMETQESRCDALPQELNSLRKENKSGINLGEVDRSQDDCTRLRKYLECINRSSPRQALYSWKIIMIGEGGNGPSQNAIGISVTREIIRDIYELASTHSIFTNVGGRLIFTPEEKTCGACNQGKPCSFRTRDTFVSLGMVTQMGIGLGVRWPIPLSLLTTESILEENPIVTMTMTAELFPSVHQIMHRGNHIGDFKTDVNGDVLPLNLHGVKSPFAFPHVIILEDLLTLGHQTDTSSEDSSSQLVKINGLSERVPISSVGVYLTSALQKMIENTESTFAARNFRIGMGGKLDNYAPWKRIYSTGTIDLRNAMSIEDRGIRHDVFISKIKFGPGIGEADKDGNVDDLSLLRRAIFKDVMKNKPEFRHQFLRLVSGCDNPNLIQAGGLKIIVVTSNCGFTTRVRSCHGIFEITAYKTAGDLETYLNHAFTEESLLFNMA